MERRRGAQVKRRVWLWRDHTLRTADSSRMLTRNGYGGDGPLSDRRACGSTVGDARRLLHGVIVRGDVVKSLRRNSGAVEENALGGHRAESGEERLSLRRCTKIGRHTYEAGRLKAQWTEELVQICEVIGML